MRIAAIQTGMGLSPDICVPHAEALLAKAMKDEQKPDLLVLPEYFAFYGTSTDTARLLAKPLHETEPFLMAQSFARRNGVNLQAGTILARVPGDDRVENVSVVFGRRGEILAEYPKIHLFDAAGLDSGSYRESDYIRPGSRLTTWQIDGVTFGTAICYDIRFPEMFRALRLAGAEVITLPAAFTPETGAAHWELLARARAIETQCHLLAVGLAGAVDVDGVRKACFGHSLIVDAWGRVTTQAGEGEAILAAELDLVAQANLRARMPILEHRRLAGICRDDF